MAEPTDPPEPAAACAKCGHTDTGPVRLLPRHGWPMPTTQIDTVTGAVKWKVVLCVDATPEQVAFYRAGVAEQQRRKDAVIQAKGFEGHGKEQLGL